MNIHTNNHAPYVNILVHQIEQLRYKQNYLKNEYFQIFKKLSQVPHWVCQLGLYKTSLYSRGKDAMIQDLKIKIQTLNPSYTEHPISSPILLLNSAIFVALEALGEGLQMFFQHKKRNNV